MITKEDFETEINKTHSDIYVYASTLRPVSIGTYPRDGMVDFWNFDERALLRKGPLSPVDLPDQFRAWGLVYYNRKLTPEEVRAYDFLFVSEAHS